LIRSLAEIDLDSLGGRAARLPVDGLLQLSEPRQKNLLRYALRLLGLSTPTAIHLDRILGELIPARADAQPLVSWPGACVRRYRNQLYLLPEALIAAQKRIDVAADHTYLGAGLGSLELLPGAPMGLAESLRRRGLTVRFRQGGEEIQPEGQAHTRKLKKLLQEEGIVPWMRDRLPLLYAGDELVAVADLWLAASAVARPGLGIRWRDRPAVH
jgi:tRNA(Ile)-lysidine synthase